MDSGFNAGTGRRVREMHIALGMTRERLAEVSDISVQFCQI